MRIGFAEICIAPKRASLVCVLAIVAGVGCDSTGNGSNEPRQSIEPWAKTKVLPHDFGVVVSPLMQPLRHEFAIENNTRVAWTVKEISNTCSCTVADMASTTILPGASETALVVYSPVGEGSFDDERKTLVRFNESEAPVLVLTVSAKVRTPLALDPQQVIIPRVAQNLERTESVEVLNYSNEVWDKCIVEGQSEWLRVSLRSLPLIETEPKLRQRWEALLVVNTNGMKAGEHSSVLTVIANSQGHEYSGNLPVKLLVTTPVRAIPEHLFFGNVGIAETVSQKLKIRFSPDVIPEDSRDISFEHSLGDQLSLDWVNAEGDTWELNATLTLDSDFGYGRSTLKIVFPGNVIPAIELPVFIFPRRTVNAD